MTIAKISLHCILKKSVFNKSRTPKTRESYKKQRDFYVNLLRKTKKGYFENINVKDINNNEKFWMTIKPFFSKKDLNIHKLTLIEKSNLSRNNVIANSMSQYPTSITKQLILKKSFQLKNLINKTLITAGHNHISIENNKFSNNTQSELFTFNLVLSDKTKQ